MENEQHAQPQGQEAGKVESVLMAAASYIFANEDTREDTPMTDGKMLHRLIVKALATLRSLHQGQPKGDEK